MFKKGLAVVLLLLIFDSAKGQYFVTGDPPASVQWSQIKTDRYQLIFPMDYTDRALAFASKLDYAFDRITHSLSWDPKKRISIILHTQTAFANGLLAWAPSRIEAYLTPHQDIYAQSWDEQLILHEVRHFVQVDKLNQGFTKALSVIFGEQGTAATLGLFVPRWYLEGDAVVTETLLSHAGRGRMPNFIQGVRALILEKGYSGYKKSVLGSYQENIPNRYEFGYLANVVNRVQKGRNVFAEEEDKIGRSFWLKSVFSPTGLRGGGKVKYFDQAMNYLEEQWKKQDAQLQVTEREFIGKRGKGYLSHENLTNDGNFLYAEEKSLNNMPQFVRITTEGERTKVAKSGFRAHGRFAYSEGALIWDEEVSDRRYSLRSFSEVRIRKVSSGKVRTLKKKTRWYSPDLSDDGRLVALVEASQQGDYRLLVVSSEDGSILKTLPNPDKVYYQHPTWADDSTIVVIENTSTGQSLVSLRYDSNERKVLVPKTYKYLSRPTVYRGEVYLSGSFSGIENIYSVPLDGSGGLRQRTSSRFGATGPTLLNDTLYYSDYSSEGYKVAKVALQKTMDKPLEEVHDMALNLHDSIQSQEGEAVDFSKTPKEDHSVKRYSKWNLFRFHSWSPLFFVEDNSDVHPGISIQSQNTLGTSQLTLGYRFFEENKDERYYLKYRYSGLYPILDLEITTGERDVFSSVTLVGGPMGDVQVPFSGEHDITQISPRITIPLRFSDAVRDRQLSFYTDFSYLHYSGFTAEVEVPGQENISIDFEQNDVGVMEYGINYYSLEKTAPRQLQSRNGILLTAAYAQELGSGGEPSWVFGAGSKIYLPGIKEEHGVTLGGAWQLRNSPLLGSATGTSSNRYELNELVELPRGYDFLSGRDYYYGSVSYVMPIVYPDWGVPFYVRRISVAPFYDGAINGSYGGEYDYVYSYGAELSFDANFLRYDYPFSFGVRFIQKNIPTPHFSNEVFFSINFY